MDPVAVALAGTDVGHVAVPAVAGDFGQVYARLKALVIEEAQLDPFRDLGEDTEVRASPIGDRAQLVRAAGPDLERRGDGDTRQGGCAFGIEVWTGHGGSL